MTKRCTVKGTPSDPDAPKGVPTGAKLADGQYANHFVLCPEDRAKGYVEPYREKYVHVGPPGPRFSLRDLTPDEEERLNEGANAEDRVVKYEDYPESERPAVGRIWTQKDLDRVDKGCGTVTIMPKACAETYAAQPDYYGSTFCCGCGKYFPVGARGEFVWEGTDQRVGTRRTDL